MKNVLSKMGSNLLIGGLILQLAACSVDVKDDSSKKANEALELSCQTSDNMADYKLIAPDSMPADAIKLEDVPAGAWNTYQIKAWQNRNGAQSGFTYNGSTWGYLDTDALGSAVLKNSNSSLPTFYDWALPFQIILAPYGSTPIEMRNISQVILASVTIDGVSQLSIGRMDGMDSWNIGSLFKSANHNGQYYSKQFTQSTTGHSIYRTGVIQRNGQDMVMSVYDYVGSSQTPYQTFEIRLTTREIRKSTCSTESNRIYRQ